MSMTTLVCFNTACWICAQILSFIAFHFPGKFENQSVYYGKSHLLAPDDSVLEIWIPIKLGELLLTAYIFSFDFPFIYILPLIVPCWVIANLFQCLWQFTLRPSYRYSPWIGSMYVTIAAFSIMYMHSTISKAVAARSSWGDKFPLLISRIPLSIHMVWLFVVCLESMNSWADTRKLQMSSKVMIAKISTFVAAIAGAGLTYVWHDPVISLVFAWTLGAIESNTRQNLQRSTKIAGIQTTLITMEAMFSRILMGSFYMQCFYDAMLYARSKP